MDEERRIANGCDKRGAADLFSFRPLKPCGWGSGGRDNDRDIETNLSLKGGYLCQWPRFSE